MVNNTGKEQQLRLLINAAAGWKLLGSGVDELTLAAKDSIFIPVRLSPIGEIQGGKVYVTNAYVSMNGFSVANAVWNISTTKVSAWNAITSTNKLYFTQAVDSTYFTLYVSNKGNFSESFTVTANSEKGILIKNSSGHLVSSQNQSISLKVNQDTTLHFVVFRDDEPLMPDDYKTDNEKVYRLNLKVINDSPDNSSKGSWGGSVNFVKLADKRNVEESIFQSFPLTIEWNNYNVLNPYTYSSLGMYGTKSLSKNRSVNYYYQSSFVQNAINWNTFLGNYFYVGYFSNLYDVEMGDIGAGRSGSRLVGKGIKGSVKYKNHQVGLTYIGNSPLFSNSYVTGFGGFYNFRSNGFKAETYYERTQSSVFNKANTAYVTSDMSYQISPKHMISLGSGYSNEEVTGDSVRTTTGYRASLGYVGNVKKYNVSIHSQYHSPFYTPRRGVVSTTGSISYPISYKERVRGGVSHYKSQPAYLLMDGTQIDSVYNGRTNYFLQLTHTGDGESYVVQPEYISYRSNFIDANSAGVNFEYRTQINSNVNLFSTVYGGQNNFPSHTTVDPIFVGNMRLSVRYKSLNANIRYYYGPFYLNEQYTYVNTLENPQRFFGTFYFDQWFAKNKMKVNVNFNYNYTTIRSRHQIVSRPELFYYTTSRMQFSLYSSYLLYANAEYERTTLVDSYAQNDQTVVPASVFSRVEFGFGIKLNVNVPAGLDRNYNALVVVFKDVNGNGIKDVNEKGVENILIGISKTDEQFSEDNMIMDQPEVYELITNEKGEVKYNHLPKGNYKIELIPLTASEGWYGGGVIYQYIANNQTINIPLSKGARLSGGIFVERDVNSDEKDLVLRGIRVTAMNQLTGQAHTALTDANGNYTMYLPNGNYLVAINEGAVGTRFQFANNNLPLNIESSSRNFDISFNLIEKKRQINFGSQSSSNSRQSRPMVKDRRDVNEIMEDDNFLPVKELTSKAKYVVQLFDSEKGRMLKSSFDTLQRFTPVYCEKGDGGEYLYYSMEFSKKGAANKLLKIIKQMGYDRAILLTPSKNIKESTVKTAVFQSELSTPTRQKVIKIISTAEELALYRIQIESSAILFPAEEFDKAIPDIDVVYLFKRGDINYYSVGAFKTEAEAKKYLKSFKEKYNTLEIIVTQYFEKE